MNLHKNSFVNLMKSISWSVVLLLIVCGLTAGCLAQNMPAAAPASQSASATALSSSDIATALPTQTAKLFNLDSKTANDVIQDFKQCSKNYQDFKKPTVDTKSTDDFTERDYLLESLSAGMGGTVDWLSETDNTNDINYSTDAKSAILNYYYCKHLYDMVESGKITVADAKAEDDNLRALSGDNTIDFITNLSTTIDSGSTFTEIRKAHPEWFKDSNASVTDKK